ncbi:MAG: RNA polymerase subunit sigma [Alphaproteobacteria bacterium 64-11]|nr:sigma-70 family RNA polymerase sigma factor [Alphaproteobacteria bacterium]OJU13110.1 MAG: RNA polymerase subunit sigma [Alphaproteobacteria bacterium 64-11]
MGSQDQASSPERLVAMLRRVAAFQDRQAFQELFAHFAPRIKAYLVRGGTASQQAEDLAQEAMLAVWRKAAQFDSNRASAATWIFTIARNLRIDMHRRERHPRFDPADPFFMPDSPDPADSALQTRQREHQLRKAIQALPPDQFRIVMLSFFSEKPHSQIAAELDIPLGTVKSRIRLAMMRLKTLLGDES